MSKLKICYLKEFVKLPYKALISLYKHFFNVFLNLIFMFPVLVYEKEKKFGLNPEKELTDNGFHEYQRL